MVNIGNKYDCYLLITIALGSGYNSALVECCYNFWIHVDHNILMDCNPLVTLFHLLIDPIAEAVAEDGSCDIDDPLLWKLELLLIAWEIFGSFLSMLFQEVGDVLEGQPLILWNITVPNIIAFDDYERTTKTLI